MGAVNEKKLERLCQAERIFIEALRNARLYGQVAQVFVLLQPVKSVAVIVDDGYYVNAHVLHIVERVGFMTERWVRLVWICLPKLQGKTSMRSEACHVFAMTSGTSRWLPSSGKWSSLVSATDTLIGGMCPSEYWANDV